MIVKPLANSIGVKWSRVEAGPPQNILEQFIFSNGGIQCRNALIDSYGLSRVSNGSTFLFKYYLVEGLEICIKKYNQFTNCSGE